jgi:hypothetical protein
MFDASNGRALLSLLPEPDTPEKTVSRSPYLRHTQQRFGQP